MRGEYWRSFPAALDPYSHRHPLHHEGTLGTYADAKAGRKEGGGFFNSWRKKRRREREEASLAQAAAMLQQTGYVPMNPQGAMPMPQPETGAEFIQPRPMAGPGMPVPQPAPSPAPYMPMPAPSPRPNGMPMPEPAQGSMSMPVPMAGGSASPAMMSMPTPGPSTMAMPGAGVMPMSTPSHGAMPMPSPSLGNQSMPHAHGVQPVLISGYGPYDGFLHHSSYSILYEGELYPSALHLFEAMKFEDTRPDISAMIRDTQSPDEVFAISREAENLTRPDWHSVAVGKMDDVLYLKFRQHGHLRSMLLETGNAPLVYAEPNDHFWGEGHMGQGQNQLGQALMRVRDRLRAELSA